ncbi:hypothetical protein [Sphingomonas sp. G-3-2-10]|uniref:hypothetical protein n=1 Tax=Sphingomonas sp. G-3-2-10 TaxID=2728838 RepID=UPI00146CA414|nr:hypothetical protein [Sphingomonas sp. G-3-2-10]NML07460.1 hypothetical protein [Sphingomonas sp. G-3-2-10]
MGEGGYNGGLTVEGRWGCIAAASLGVPAFMFLLLADALGDCAPGTACKKGFLTQVALPSATIAIGAGLLVYWAIKIARRKNSG